MRKQLALALLALCTALPAAHAAGTTAETFADIKQTLGSVPGFFKAFPEEGLAGAWEDMKSVQMNPNGAVPGKIKELIGLAVSAQIPCKYCVYFHTEAAKLNGATDREIREALVVASDVRRWSTFLNGMQVDESKFRKDVDKMIEFSKEQMEKKDAPAPTPINVTDAASAYRDVEQTFGFVPNFVKLYPEAGIAGLWKLTKNLVMNPNGAVSSKYRDLIGLGVAAQVPCKYCTYFHTESLKLEGATDNEIREAVAMAASTRHWSTWLNGLQIDDATFKREIGQVMSYLRKQSSQAPLAGEHGGSKRAKQPAKDSSAE